MEADSSESSAPDLVTTRMLFSGLQVKPPPPSTQQPGPRHTIDAILGLTNRPPPPDSLLSPGGAESSGEESSDSDGKDLNDLIGLQDLKLSKNQTGYFIYMKPFGQRTPQTRTSFEIPLIPQHFSRQDIGGCNRIPYKYIEKYR
ncbi:hypothetical protein L9F63_012883, partial [Diploptera punctata]